MGWWIFLIGKLSFALIGVAVGGKLALQTRRQGGMGLHTIALAAICMGGAGLLVMPAAQALASVPLACAGEVAVRAGMLLLCVFIAGTFRPGAAGIAAAALCGSLVLGTMVWDMLTQPSLVAYDYTRASSHASQLSVALPFAWSSVESALLWSRARRQLALGLVSPAVSTRYLLWSLTTAFFVAICLLAITAGLAEAAQAKGLAELAQAGRGVLYLFITVCVWLGLFRHEPSSAAGPARSDATA